MMVVTSPMGDQAPPLFAAMTITLAKKIHRSFLLAINRRSSMTMMIVVVMLSSAADMKKVMIASSHIGCACCAW